MRWTMVNDAGAARASEDHVAVFERGAASDILVLDGATALVGDGEDGGHADVVWFVRAFADAFGRLLDAGTSDAALLDAAAQAASRAWRARTRARTGGHERPPYAWPVASLLWLRVGQREDGTAAVRLRSLGDCKALLRLPDGSVRDLDPFDNPQEASLYREVAALRAEGVHEPADVFARMLPSLRARRTAQNTAPRPQVLCALPQGAFGVRESAFEAPPGSLLLAMSDGFWRLVEPYGLYTTAGLMDACAGAGLEALLRALRGHEGAPGPGSLAVKRADDACAVLWPVSGTAVPAAGSDRPA